MRALGWIVGYLLGLLSGRMTHAGAWDDASVLVTNRVGDTTSHASGTLLGGDGETAYVLSVRHLLDRGVGTLVVRRRDGHGYRAKLWAQDTQADLSLLGVHDTGDIPKVDLAPSPPSAGIMAGFGGGYRAEGGRYAGRTTEGDVMYTFAPVEGDSGGGLFTPQGRLAGVVWGRGEDGGVAVGPTRVASFLDRAGLHPTARRTEGTMKAATLITLVALAQAPPMPSKDMPVPEAPRKTQPSPQGPTARGTPQVGQYEYQEQGTALAQAFTLPPRTYTIRRRVEVRELEPIVEFDDAPPARASYGYEGRSSFGYGGYESRVEFGALEPACVPTLGTFGVACRPRLFGGGEKIKSKQVYKIRRGPFAGL